MKQTFLGLAAVTITALSGGCTLPTNPAASFRDPIPQSSDVALAVPGSSGGSTTSARSSRIHPLNAPSAGTSYAQYYQFTRDVTDGVDFDTAWILGSIWFVVNTPPTTITATQAVWGPTRDALSPVSWRLTVTDQGGEDYLYELDGRPSTSTSSADWKPVLTGEGYGKDRSEYRSGWLKWDASALSALDPSRSTDSGTTKITYDLTAYPATIHVVRPPTDHLTIDVTHEAGGGGEVDIAAKSDVRGGGTLDAVALVSRWIGSGAGRADVKISGSDLPASVDVSECWDASFARVYYLDSIGLEAASGSAGACVFAQAKL